MSALVARSCPTCRPLAAQQLADLPDIFALEHAVRAMHPDKAAGVDGIGAEVYRSHAALTARKTYPLFLKMRMRAQWVPEFCGGWLVPLFKGKGSRQQLDSHRAILLEPSLARAFSRAIRPKLEAGYSATAFPMQYGGRKGLSTTALHLQVRVWQQNAAAAQHSLAILFLDLKSAFYQVAKPLLAHDDISPVEIAALFQRMRLPPSAFQQFMHNLQHSDLVAGATGSDVAAGCVRSMLSSTWFAIQDGSNVMAPKTGSRPGDPLADVLFSFVMSQILDTAMSRIGTTGHLQHSSLADLVMPHCTTWVDDIAVAVFAPAHQVCDRLATVTSHLLDAMTEHGMTLNFAPGKTSAVVHFRGLGSQQSRRHLETMHPQGLPILSEHHGVHLLPIVPHYKHLGGFITRQGHLLPEIRVRSAQTMANVQPIKKLTQHASLDLAHRRHLLQSMGLSILTLHSGTWHNLNQGEYDAWASGVHKLYQCLHRVRADMPEHRSLIQLAEDMQSPLPMELLHVQKLRLCAQILRSGDEFMFQALVANYRLAQDRSWITSLQRSVAWLQEQLGPDCVPPALAQMTDVAQWWDLQPFARDLKKRVHAALRAHQLRIQTLNALNAHATFQKQLFRDMNWSPPPDEVPPPNEHRCPDCQATFATPAGLAVHQSGKHGA
eukprot:Skav214597  [mRNA]  locus=scaffold57:529051:531036:+ [translate_table: standard]